jgi:hypothetical protein
MTVRNLDYFKKTKYGTFGIFGIKFDGVEKDFSLI